MYPLQMKQPWWPTRARCQNLHRRSQSSANKFRTYKIKNFYHQSRRAWCEVFINLDLIFLAVGLSGGRGFRNNNVLQVLRPYLQLHKGPSYAALPDFPFTPDEAIYQQIRRELAGDWNARSTAAQKAMRKVRTWARHPVARISFA